MNKIIKLEFREHLVRDSQRTTARDKWRVAGVSFALAVLLFGVLLIAGCGTIQSPITIQAFQSTVTLSEQFALESHPEAVPEIRAATGIVCAEAAKTNTSPAGLVTALTAANLSATGKFIVNSSLAVYNVVYAAVGTNQAVMHEYEKALCAGMQGGLPSDSAAKNAPMTARLAITAPHLR